MQRGWLFPVCVFSSLWQHHFLLRGRQIRHFYSTPSFRRRRPSETEGCCKIPWAWSSLEARGCAELLGNLLIPRTALVSGGTCWNRVVFPRTLSVVYSRRVGCRKGFLCWDGSYTVHLSPHDANFPLRIKGQGTRGQGYNHTLSPGFTCRGSGGNPGCPVLDKATSIIGIFLTVAATLAGWGEFLGSWSGKSERSMGRSSPLPP